MHAESTLNKYNNQKDIQKNAILPTNDVIFHCLFGTVGSEKITKNFLEKIIKKQVEDINLDLNLNLIRNYYDEKLGILDVRAKDGSGINYNIEMQNIATELLPERILSYWSKLYIGNLKAGDSYSTLNKTIAILIINDEMDKLKGIEMFHTKWNIREETYSNIILTDYFQIHILELKKYSRKRTKENKNIWLDFLLEPDGKEVLEAMKENEEINEARKKWEKITQDEKIRDRALRLEIARLDYNTGMECALKKGKEEGIKEGKEEGYKKALIDIAKQMAKQGKSLEEIMNITGLSKEEIEKN